MHLILNVDDTDAARYAKTRTLQRAGFMVIEASTGREALELFASKKPDLVMLDIKLPDMSGHDVCRQVKESSKETMVLQISATYVAPKDRVRGLDVGADAYLTEPAAPEELIANVRALLRLRDAERQKTALLEQKELLLRELNHRVKNNLQLISSMLSMQSRRAANTEAREELMLAQRRVRAIASLYTRLYQNDRSIDAIDLAEYLRDLASQLRTLLLPERTNIQLVAVADNAVIDVDRATAIGLIITELASNAAKYAFPDSRAGTITIGLKNEGATCRVSVSDNGCGKNLEADDEAESTGLKLVELLTAQIGGRLTKQNDPGLSVTVEFELSRDADR